MVSPLIVAMALQSFLSPKPAPYPDPMRQAVHTFVTRSARLPLPTPPQPDQTKVWRSSKRVNLPGPPATKPIVLLKQPPLVAGQCSVPLLDALKAKAPARDSKMLHMPDRQSVDRGILAQV